MHKDASNSRVLVSNVFLLSRNTREKSVLDSELGARKKRANTIFHYLDSERDGELIKSKYKHCVR